MDPCVSTLVSCRALSRPGWAPRHINGSSSQSTDYCGGCTETTGLGRHLPSPPLLPFPFNTCLVGARALVCGGGNLPPHLDARAQVAEPGSGWGGGGAAPRLAARPCHEQRLGGHQLPCLPLQPGLQFLSLLGVGCPPLAGALPGLQGRGRKGHQYVYQVERLASHTQGPDLPPPPETATQGRALLCIS